MKQINNYIQEKLILNKTVKSYKYHPQNLYELREILNKRLDEDKNANLNDIDIRKINSFYDYDTETGLFEDLDPHNIDISKWNVSQIKDMKCMFAKCEKFTGEGLESWDVSNVENMNGMFCGCINFDCDLSKWNVSKVENMVYMFAKCEKFTGEGLESWKPLKCKDAAMIGMFYNCDSIKNIPSWYHE